MYIAHDDTAGQIGDVHDAIRELYCLAGILQTVLRTRIYLQTTQTAQVLHSLAVPYNITFCMKHDLSL